MHTNHTVFLLKEIIMKPCEMFRKVMNKFPRDQTCLKHEIFENKIFSLHSPSIQILNSNSGNILFKVSCGIWLVNVFLSTELLSVCVSWGNGAYAITLCVFMSVCLCAFAHFWVLFEPFGQNQTKLCQKDGYLTDDGIPALCEKRHRGR